MGNWEIATPQEEHLRFAMTTSTRWSFLLGWVRFERQAQKDAIILRLDVYKNIFNF